MIIKLASPHDIQVTYEPSAREVRYQKERLVKEGQIMPTVVKVITEPGEPQMYQTDLDHDEAFHLADAQIRAAQDLGWKTVQVTY